MAIPASMTLDQVVDALDIAIDSGVWNEVDGICGHCYYVGEVYEPNPYMIDALPPEPISSCKECLVHRAMWNSYLENNP
jgi:hypothetical protein